MKTLIKKKYGYDKKEKIFFIDSFYKIDEKYFKNRKNLFSLKKIIFSFFFLLILGIFLYYIINGEIFIKKQPIQSPENTTIIEDNNKKVYNEIEIKNEIVKNYYYLKDETFSFSIYPTFEDLLVKEYGGNLEYYFQYFDFSKYDNTSFYFDEEKTKNGKFGIGKFEYGNIKIHSKDLLENISDIQNLNGIMFYYEEDENGKIKNFKNLNEFFYSNYDLLYKQYGLSKKNNLTIVKNKIDFLIKIENLVYYKDKFQINEYIFLKIFGETLKLKHLSE